MTDVTEPALKAGYVICTEERSGSNLLCHHLESTGVLGRPDEVFKYAAAVARLRHAGPSGLYDRLKPATTANGVYGFKLFSGHFDFIAGTDWLERLPALQFVYLERRDLLGQAISLVKATQTRSFRASITPMTEPFYDRAAIAFALQRLTLAQARWKIFFATNDLRALPLTYEEICDDPMAAVRSIAERVDVDVAGIVSSAPAMSVQRNAVSDEWRERYVQDAGGLRRIAPLGFSALRNSGGTVARKLVGRFPFSSWYGPTLPAVRPPE
ncbi:MAG: Stf0 sulfotransferase [Alphaproteobacteria bacterium]|nr:Stf0 sulfotransferase [Alphaproteobacteria bacterium]